MGSKTLEVLKEGLIQLKNQAKTRKDELCARLANKEHISEEEEHWLDNDANFVDEDTVIGLLEKASDYEHGLKNLSPPQKKIVERLEELGGGSGVKPVVSNKRKRPAERRNKPQAEKKKKAPVFTKKENATLKQKVDILDWHHAQGKKQNQGKTAAHWNVTYPNLCLKQPTISAWLKDEKMYRKQYEEALAMGRTGNVKRVRQTEHPEVNEMLELWIAKAMSDEVQLNGEILRQKWNRFADLAGVPTDDRLSLSEGWLDSLKKRCGLRNFKRHGEAGSAGAEDVKSERERVRERICELVTKHGYRLKDIFNMDETGLFWALPPDRGLMDKQTSGVKGSKKRLTYAFTMNADGSEKLPPIIIGKSARPRPFQRKSGTQLGFYYRNNAKAWMTMILYQEWLHDWDEKLRRTGRKIILFQDNFSAHVPPSDLTNIHVENFAPNLTAHVQPADAGIIRCFKAHYRASFMNRAIDRYEANISVADIYDINILEAMRLANVAWKEVDTTTIRNCWRKTGIIPEDLFNSTPPTTPAVPISSLLNNDDDDPIKTAEKEVCDALSHLEALGVLQAHNRMDLTELLNPANESHVQDSGTDEEIHKAVMERRKADQDREDGMEVEDGLSDTEDIKPSRREALEAASTLSKYVADLNSPFARKLEAVLAGFGRQTRLDASNSLRSTVVTDFFTPEHK